MWVENKEYISFVVDLCGGWIRKKWKNYKLWCGGDRRGLVWKIETPFFLFKSDSLTLLK